MSAVPCIDPLEVVSRLYWAEGDDLELKSARGGLPHSLWETYSAMANSQGGVILLGVEDDGRVSGIADPPRLKKGFWDTINNRGKVNVNLLGPGDLVELTEGSATLLAIRVPRAARRQRPVFLGQNPLTGTFRRNFEGDYHCTEQEVGRMLADRAEEPADSRILERFTLDDLDPLSLQQYRHRFASHKPSHPWLSEDDRTLLAKLGGWRKDRESGMEGLTVAGLLMFGREEALREALHQYQVDYREKLSDDPQVRWTDRLTLDGTWAGNLFQFYLRVIQRLAADLKLPFQLGADLFRKGETVVHEAIREALVNALIHADYFGMGGVVVEKYRDRLEFSNPGSLLVSLDQLMRGNVSECRNKSLQIMFMMIGAGEKAGSGIDKIRRGWESQHWRQPRVSESVQPARVQWMLPMISLIPEVSLARLHERFGPLFARFSPPEVQALVTAEIEAGVDNVRMRQIAGGHAADMTRLLQGLVAQGALRQEGTGRWARYRLHDPVAPTGGSAHIGGGSVHIGGDSAHIDADSAHIGRDSAHIGGDSAHIARGSAQVEANSVEIEALPAASLQVLHEIAAPARNQRHLSPQEMEQIILRLCRDRWLTRRQLADLLQRNPDSIRSRFLTPMVAHGYLRLRYPDKPNRADQAYTLQS